MGAVLKLTVRVKTSVRPAFPVTMHQGIYVEAPDKLSVYSHPGGPG